MVHDDSVFGEPRDEAGPARVLVIEDEPELRGMLCTLLAAGGYQVEEAPDGQRGLHLGLSRRYEILLLDRRLPGIDGLDLLVRLRAKGVDTPVLVLSALGNPADRVEGLDSGADDYLAKPFDIEELLARLRALGRRHLDRARVLPVPHGRIDLDTRLVHVDGARSVRLSERESELLAILAAGPGWVHTRAGLLTRVFPDTKNPGVVDTYVYYLRCKLGRAVIDTVRGRGYQLGRR
jgi:two-component system response regulator QseB